MTLMNQNMTSLLTRNCPRGLVKGRNPVIDEEKEGHKRFDEFSSKENYASKVFKTHLTVEETPSSVLESSPVPTNAFLTFSELDDYMKDLIRERKSFKFLKIQDNKNKRPENTKPISMD